MHSAQHDSCGSLQRHQFVPCFVIIDLGEGVHIAQYTVERRLAGKAICIFSRISTTQ